MAQRRLRIAMCVGLLVVLAWTTGSAAAASKKPVNLVLISIDTLRQDELSCYGHDRHTTPVLDALAREGRRFTNVFATSSITAPSHMAIFTSQSPFEHGVGYDRKGLRAGSAYTLAEVLQRHGYETAAFVGLSHKDVWFGPENGFANGFALWRRGRNLWDPTQELRDWLGERRTRREPFFLFLHGFDVHEPHLLPSGLDPNLFDSHYSGSIPGSINELSRQVLVEDLREASYRQMLGSLMRVTEQWRALVLGDPNGVERIRRLYDAQLYYADRGIGQVLQWLKEFGLETNTLVVVVADHGQEFGEHGRVAEHLQLYDELLRVPLILRGPGISPGGPIPQLMSTMDIAPTVLELLGAPVPHTARGVSFSGLLRGASRKVLRKAVCATVLGDVAIRTLEWKWIQHPDGRQELYRVADDPMERKNLAGQEPHTAAALAQQFKHLLQRDHPAPISQEALDHIRRHGYW